jgi:hypothetical protein
LVASNWDIALGTDFYPVRESYCSNRLNGIIT